MAGSRTLKLSILGDVDNLNKSLKSATTDVETFGDKVGKAGKIAGAALAAAAAAAGAYAIKIGVDGVKAAIEDEKAQTQLALALKNATGATDAQIKATEAAVLQMSLATGVADDDLRPALQRLALATGSSSQAQDLLSTALDVSTATGKPLETVANALGKAYEGNTAALGKLGLGLSAAELKTMSFQDVQAKLTELFGGAAAANADTYAGKIARVQVAFSEAKETLGTALLPVVGYFIDLINRYALPAITAFADAFGNKESGVTSYISTLATLIKNLFTPILEGLLKAFGYIKDAIGENLDAFKEFGGYIADYLAPIIGTVLGGALQAVGKIAGGVIDIIGNVVGAINKVIGTAIDGINFLIRAYNAIPFLGNVPEIGKSAAAVYSSGGAASANTGVASAISSLSSIGTGSTGTGSTGGSSSSSSGGSVTSIIKGLNSNLAKLSELTDIALGVDPNAFYTGGSFRKGEEASMAAYNAQFNITVNGAVDSEGTARTVVDIINDSYYRGTGGGGRIMTG